MNGILEHVVNKVGVWLHEIVQNLQHLKILLLPLEECAESHIITVELNSRNRLQQLLSVCDYGFISFLDFLLLFLQTLELLVNLLLHHCVQVLLLNFELLDYAAE